MTLHIDQELCINCQSCSAICPTVFELDADSKVRVIVGFDENTALDDVKKAIEECRENCPVQAIKR